MPCTWQTWQRTWQTWQLAHLKWWLTTLSDDKSWQIGRSPKQPAKKVPLKQRDLADWQIGRSPYLSSRLKKIEDGVIAPESKNKISKQPAKPANLPKAFICKENPWQIVKPWQMTCQDRSTGQGSPKTR
jgi:hypothetical protein